MNRRDIFKSLAAAVIASASGLALLPEQRKLIARHLFSYDIAYSGFVHRLDVIIGQEQYGVDFRSDEKIPTEAEMTPALTVLVNHLEDVTGDSVELEVSPMQSFFA